MSKLRILAAALLMGVLAAPAAMADDSDVAGHIDLHVRGVYVAPEANIHSNVLSPGGSITDSYVPEIDATYFLTNHIGVEAIAATTNNSVHYHGLDLGSVWLLPPTVTVKYYYDAAGPIRPYVGAGVNYTAFYSPRSGALPGMRYGNNWGTALQAGVDVPLGDSPYFLNLDVKQIFLTDDVKAAGGAVHALAVINPLLFGVGFGVRF
ncbi:MAG: OmpW/AlkL family protein [Rhizomicrobium sp.]